MSPPRPRARVKAVQAAVTPTVETVPAGVDPLAPLVIALEGSVGIARAKALYQELEDAMMASSVTIDLVRATYLDVTTVQTLVAFRRAKAAAGHPVSIKGPSEMLGIMLGALGLLPLIQEGAP